MIDRVQVSRRGFLSGAGAVLSSAAALGLVGCGGSSSGGSSSGGSGASSDTGFDGTLIVGFDQEFPPYGYRDDDGSYTGFDLDLAQAVCEKEGWTYTPTPIDWDSKDAMLSSGQITCIWNGFTIEGREDSYAFTDPYMENRQVVVVRADSGITSLADLAGKNVVTQADSAALELLSAGGAQEQVGSSFARLETIGDYNPAFNMLEQGTYDAIAIDYPVAVYNIGQKTDVFAILDESLNSEHYGVGFANTDAGKELARKVQADLQALDAEGRVKELCEKYGDQGISYDLWCLPTA